MSSSSQEEKDGEVRFSVNGQTLAYLNWLARHTTLGKGPNDVARQLLIQRLSEMRQENFKDGQKP